MSETLSPLVVIKATDAQVGVINSIRTTVGAIPTRLGGESAALIALLDAVTRYYEANPTVASIEVRLTLP